MFSISAACRLITLLAFALTSSTSQAAAQKFIGYTGKHWLTDAGVLQGECNTKESSKTTGQMASIELDETALSSLPTPITNLTFSTADIQCFGHTLELVPSGQFVRWISPNTGAGIYLAPGPKTETCRSYLGVIAQNGQKTKFRGEACSNTPGLWKIQTQQ